MWVDGGGFSHMFFSVPPRNLGEVFSNLTHIFQKGLK